MISVPVSIGEAVDKYCILAIKQKEIKDESRLKCVKEEMDVIYPYISDIIKNYHYHYLCLLKVNKDIWDLSSQVRDPTIDINYKNSIFLETFLKNDARFRIKSKFNKLSSSTLQEQKSYPGNNIIINYNANYDHYIRYLTMCYDNVILQCGRVDTVKELYKDDPNIIVTAMLEKGTTLNTSIEPIPNLLHKYNFSKIDNNTIIDTSVEPDNVPKMLENNNLIDTSVESIPKTLQNNKIINYLCGGRLGDFIHALYVIMCNYKSKGIKGNIYITDNLAYAGDCFSCPLSQTFSELYPIVIQQEYIQHFSIYKDEHIDVNLNLFRHYPRLYHDSWLEIMANRFHVPLLEEPWIKITDKNINYKDIILIHQSHHHSRYIPQFIQLMEMITYKNKCLFITCNPVEYDNFPLKHRIPLELKSTLEEMYDAINGCKLFIGNQSSPLAMAYSLGKPILCQLTEGRFYDKKHYKELNWMGPYGNCFDTLYDNIIL